MLLGPLLAPLTMALHNIVPAIIYFENILFLCYYNWSVSGILLPAVGCADVIAPRNTWMRRADDRVEVGCPTTGAKWTMTCVDGQWTGDQMTGAKCPGVPGVVIPGPGSSIVSERPVVGPITGDDSNKSFITSIPDSKYIHRIVFISLAYVAYDVEYS